MALSCVRSISCINAGLRIISSDYGKNFLEK
jgi:hypothetical protein